jgi:hypothetical protein
MRRFILALALCAAATGARADDARQNVMKKIADVLAIATVCPELTFNEQLIVFIARASHIDVTVGGADYDAVALLAADRVRIFNLAPQTACAAGRQLYGPGGESVKGLMADK